MKDTRWLVVMVLVILTFGSSSVSADIVPVWSFDPIDELLLDEQEVERIRQLQQITEYIFMSDVSPDDQTVFMATYKDRSISFGFLNIHDGSTVIIQSLLQRARPVSNVAWRDSETLIFLAMDDFFSLAVAAIDRSTGEITTTPIEFPGFPISLSPDGRRILLAQKISDEQNEENDYHTPALDESPFDQSIPLFPSDRESPLPALWSSHDPHQPRMLAFSSEQVILSVIDLPTMQTTHLITVPRETDISPPAWTPDSSKLAFARFNMPDLDRRAVMLSDIVVQDALGNLPPADNPFFQSNVIDVFDLANGVYTPAALQARDGSGDIFSRVAWSPDGQKLLVQMNHPPTLTGRTYPTYLYPDRSYLRFYDAALQPTGEFDSPIIDAPHLSIPFFASPDEVIINAAHGMNQLIMYYNIVSGEFRPVSIREGMHKNIRATHLSREVVFMFSSFQHPPEIYRMTWDGDALSALTYYNDSASQANAIRTDTITIPMANGTTRSGYLLQPADAPFPPQQAPLVVWQDGGPGGAVTNEWAATVENPFNLLPNMGIPLLIVPLQGREGFGADWYNALADEQNFGIIDIDDGAQIVEYMIAQGYTAPNQVGITGCSYGGYFTAQSLSRHPNLYAAANPQCTLLDLFHEWQFGLTWYISYLMGTAPTAHSARYLAHSPTYHAERVTTPLLIFHGTEDFLPIKVAVNYHDQVDENGTPVTFLAFLGEGHGLRESGNQLTAAQAQVAWFRRHLTGTPAVADGDTSDGEPGGTEGITPIPPMALGLVPAGETVALAPFAYIATGIQNQLNFQEASR